MKVLAEKVNARIEATVGIVAELPEVFTKKMYEELRDKQIHQKWMESGNPYESWRRKISRNESAFSFDNLRSEGFMMLVKEEKITITVEVYDGYDFDVYDSRTDTWERWTYERVLEVSGVDRWSPDPRAHYKEMERKGYRIEYNAHGKKEIEAVRNWYRVSENLLDFLDERG